MLMMMIIVYIMKLECVYFKGTLWYVYSSLFSGWIERKTTTTVNVYVLALCFEQMEKEWCDADGAKTIIFFSMIDMRQESLDKLWKKWNKKNIENIIVWVCMSPYMYMYIYIAFRSEQTMWTRATTSHESDDTNIYK